MGQRFVSTALWQTSPRCSRTLGAFAFTSRSLARFGNASLVSASRPRVDQPSLDHISEEPFTGLTWPRLNIDLLIGIKHGEACSLCRRGLVRLTSPSDVGAVDVSLCVYCSGFLIDLVRMLRKACIESDTTVVDHIVDSLQNVFGARSVWWDHPLTFIDPTRQTLLPLQRYERRWRARSTSRAST